MRNLLFLIALLSFAACKKPQSQMHKCGESYLKQCTDPNLQTIVQGVEADSLQGMTLRKYVKDDNFSQLLEEVSAADTPAISSEFDYEIYLPAMNKTVRISDYNSTQRQESVAPCKAFCWNRIDSISVTSAGIPVQHQITETGEVTFWLYIYVN